MKKTLSTLPLCFLFLFSIALPAPAANEDFAWIWGSIRDRLGKLSITFNNDFTWLIVVGVGLFPILIYYLWAWNKVGRDPKPGKIAARYEPPDGLSPAAVRYVCMMTGDEKAFAAALVSLATKGQLVINQSDEGYYLTRANNLAPPTDLPAEEQFIMQKVISSRQKVSIEQNNWRVVGQANRDFKKMLSSTYGKGAFFTTNLKYALVGLAMTLVALIGIAFYVPRSGFVEPFTVSGLPESSKDIVSCLFVTPFFLVGLLLLFGFVYSLYNRFRGIADINRGKEGLLLISGLALFAVGLILLLNFSATYLIFLICAGSLNIILGGNLRAYTVSGRLISYKIEGFQQYLAAAEKDLVERLHAPSVTAEVFERFIPYTIALNVELQWAKQFVSALSRVGGEYNPTWYSSDSAGLPSLDSFVIAVGVDLADAILQNSSSPSHD